ncbi:MAG: 6-bladed beta-propeller [Bacteroidales bacterium]|nr:6-bladed beta-propeller [Bacteroidales bacterium]
MFIQLCINQELPEYSLEDIPIIIDIDSAKVAPLNVNHIQYIPLETSKECFIGHPSKVLIRNNQIYVADFDNAMALFVFDMQGKFIFKIARKGKGPGEYISFQDFDIQNNGDIYIFDHFGKKFLIFNSTGEYLRDVKTDYYLSNFCLVENKMYWSKLWESGKMFANLAAYDIVDRKIEFLLKNKKFLHDLGLLNFSTYSFYYSPNRTYYSPKFSEIIYSINNEGVFPMIGIKNLLKPPVNIIEKWSREDPYKRTKVMTEEEYFIENVYIYETDNYIVIGCMRGANRNSLLYNKHTKSACSISVVDYYVTLGVTEAKGSTGKYFFSVVDFDPENELNFQILKSRKELVNWKEGDNPVIVLFDLKM